MGNHQILFSFLPLILATGLVSSAIDFQEPQVLESQNGALSIDLELDWITFDPQKSGTAPLQTRALGGTIPGPTLRVKPGDVLQVNFTNSLQSKDYNLANATGDWVGYYGTPSTANLHLHGGHVSPVLPSDDTTLSLGPGESYQYRIQIPANHMAGTHWLHPHNHGSTSIHLGGGAALAVIVEDLEENGLPDIIRDAPERLFVFQIWDGDKIDTPVEAVGDTIFLESVNELKRRNSFVTVNGAYDTSVTMQQGTWERWRVVFAGGWVDTLDLTFRGGVSALDGGICEMQILAKDGIYLSDFPRQASTLPTPPGGRVDIMVRCSEAGEYGVNVLGNKRAFSVVVEESASISSTDLPKLDGMEFPDYLGDLRDVVVAQECNCQTRMGMKDGRGIINDKVYNNSSECMHTTHLGAVVQRELWEIHKHAYHQHVYPFQLISGLTEDDNFGYYKVGDWQDTWTDLEQRREDGYIIRFHTTQFAGNVMVHCHNPFHSDKGLMARECIRDENLEQDFECECQLGFDGSSITEDLATPTPSGTEDTSDIEEAAPSHARKVCVTWVGLKVLLLVAVIHIL